MSQELIRERWEWIKEHIRTEYRLSNVSYSTWIQNLRIADIRDHVVYVFIPANKQIMLDYITNNYKMCFEVTITELVNEDYRVEFFSPMLRSKKNLPRRKCPS